MTIIKAFATAPLAAAVFVAVLSGPAAAGSVTTSRPLPNAAYFAAGLHYCAPAEVVLVGGAPAPTGDAATVYEEVLIGAYGGDCDRFHSEEVLPRLYLSAEGS